MDILLENVALMAHRRERAVGFDHVTVEKILKPLERSSDVGPRPE
jgi:hypothetical protein